MNIKKLLLALTIVSRVTMAQILVGSGANTIDPDNSLSNPGVESGNAGFTFSGYTALTNDTTADSKAGFYSGVKFQGQRSMAMNASAANQYVEVTQSLSGKFGRLANNQVRCEIMWNYPSGSTGDYQLQLLQGGSQIVTALSLPSTGSIWTKQKVVQTAGLTGDLSCRIVSASASALVAYADRFYLGFNKQETYVPNAEMIGFAKIPGTVSCFWNRTSATFGLFTSQAACPAPTVDLQAAGPESIQTTDTDLPKFTVNSLRPGRYKVTVQTQIYSSAGDVASIGLSDDSGTTVKCKSSQVIGSGNVATPVTLVCDFEYTTLANKTFDLVGATPTGTVSILNSGTGIDTTFSIVRYPLAAELFYSSADTQWYVDSNISGANPSLGTSAVTSYTEITNASLTLTNNTGSQTAQIACASGTASTGTTCSVNESLGVVFSIPRTGPYQVCADFGWNGNVSGSSSVVETTFQLVETSNTSSTITQEGKSRVQSTSNFNVAAGSGAVTTPNHICGLFLFTTIGQKTIRLQYEQVVGGTVASSTIYGDAGASNGQRDIHFTAYPLFPNIPTLVNQNNISARVKTSTAQSFTSGVEATINFDTTDYDTNTAFDLSGDTFTCPITGKYAIMGQVTWAASVGTGSAAVNVYSNAVQIASTPVQKLSATSAKTSVPFDNEVSCTAGTTIQIKGTENLGTVALSADNKESFAIIRYAGP